MKPVTRAIGGAAAALVLLAGCQEQVPAPPLAVAGERAEAVLEATSKALIKQYKGLRWRVDGERMLTDRSGTCWYRTETITANLGFGDDGLDAATVTKVLNGALTPKGFPAQDKMEIDDKGWLTYRSTDKDRMRFDLMGKDQMSMVVTTPVTTDQCDDAALGED